jgi:RNA polymerase sigma factor (sigma-70 family)
VSGPRPAEAAALLGSVDAGRLMWCLACGAVQQEAGNCTACGDWQQAVALDFGDLYKSYAVPLRRFVRRVAADRGLPESLVDTEGVVHDTFAVLLSGSGQPIRNPAAWLFTVARNQVGKAAAAQSRTAAGDPADHLSDGSATWASVAPPADAEDIRAARAVMQAIAGLPGHQAIATYLRQIEGWSLTEFGAYINCTASTAGVHVHRGTVKVRLLEAATEAVDVLFPAAVAYFYPPPFSWTRAWEGLGRLVFRVAAAAGGVSAAAAARWLGLPLWLDVIIGIAAYGASAMTLAAAWAWLRSGTDLWRRQRRFNRWLRTGRSITPPAGTRRP